MRRYAPLLAVAVVAGACSALPGEGGGSDGEGASVVGRDRLTVRVVAWDALPPRPRWQARLARPDVRPRMAPAAVLAAAPARPYPRLDRDPDATLAFGRLTGEVGRLPAGRAAWVVVWHGVCMPVHGPPGRGGPDFSVGGLTMVVEDATGRQRGGAGHVGFADRAGRCAA
jgi:hypothetical protein